MKTEVEVASIEGKLNSCPLCDSEKDDGYGLCFHCSQCGYLQCCDYDGYYNRSRSKILGLRILK